MVGGLTGYNAGKIKFSYTDTVLTIEGKTEEIGAIGGLTVFNTKDGEINNCYIKGSIEAKGISSIIGTFVSYNDGIITNCYTCSTVSFNRTPDLLGCVSVNSVYDIENCYYDQSINPEMKAVAVGNADGIIGKSSAEMQDVKFMNLLNKNSQSENDVWIKMDSNAYPTLYTRL